MIVLIVQNECIYLSTYEEHLASFLIDIRRESILQMISFIIIRQLDTL